MRWICKQILLDLIQTFLHHLKYHLKRKYKWKLGLHLCFYHMFTAKTRKNWTVPLLDCIKVKWAPRSLGYRVKSGILKNHTIQKSHLELRFETIWKFLNAWTKKNSISIKKRIITFVVIPTVILRVLGAIPPIHPWDGAIVTFQIAIHVRFWIQQGHIVSHQVEVFQSFELKIQDWESFLWISQFKDTMDQGTKEP